MKIKFLRKISQASKKVHSYVNKSRETKRFIFTMIAIWAVVPVLTVNAANDLPVTVDSSATSITLDSTLETAQPIFSVEIRQSPHQVAKKQLKVELAAASVVPISATDGDKRELVKRAASAWNIDWKVLEAVWQVESGKQMSTAVRSYAGAQGPCQFMSGTWRSYAEDGNGDGVKNINDARDCLFGAAKLLAVNGAASGAVDGALLHYNHSLSYVAKVKRLAAEIGG